MKAIIHATSAGWHERYFKFFVQGFARHGILAERARCDKPHAGDIHVLFGPNYWKNCEQQYENYLIVNRKFIGDVNDDVAVSWNGFNGRGIFCIDSPQPLRFENAMSRSPIKIRPWKNFDSRNFLLLGQADAGRSENFGLLSDWYTAVRNYYDFASPIYRQWPNGDGHTLQQDVDRTGFSVSLNSTVAVETLMLGHPTSAWDVGSPIWSVCSRGYDFKKEPNRAALFEYLANCQFYYQEIQNGDFWLQLGKGPYGPRLCDVTL